MNKPPTAQTLKQELSTLANPAKADHCARFFKTGPGQYGEGDKFLGITVPLQRQVAKKFFREISLTEVIKVLKSPYHEHRLTALIILVYKYEQAAKEIRKTKDKSSAATTNSLQQKIYDLYLANRQHINNWDLIDVTTPKIVGAHLLTRPKERKILYQFAKSKNLWERRIAILATYTFIKAGELEDTLNIAELLVNDTEDLIHKATGWMLREAAKIDQPPVEEFLKKHMHTMPRTMLRYTIERFSPSKKDFYMG